MTVCLCLLVLHVMRCGDARVSVKSALLCDLLDAPTALAACCGFDLCYKYIWYLVFKEEEGTRKYIPETQAVVTLLCYGRHRYVQT